MRYFIIIIALAIAGCHTSSGDKSFSKPGKNYYTELENPDVAQVGEWEKMTTAVSAAFGENDIRYPKEKVPQVSETVWTAHAWRGEKIHAQILVWTKKDIPAMTVTFSDLLNEKGNQISSNNIKAGFVRYVMTDEFGEGCDERTPSKYDSSLVGDPIDIIDRIKVNANSVQPVWISISIPGNIPPGDYKGSVRINAGREFDLSLTINVDEHILPPPSEWKFDLDLWQSPNPVAIVHDVDLWSEDHFILMKPYFTMLAAAGQKVISANIINQPWGPTHTYYEEVTLIKWTKRKDGTWIYDYSIFDRYINMMMDCGITKRINCYSMVTWNLFFPYFDESTGKTESVKLNPGSQEYKDFWAPMLKDFTAHLKEKGWFEKTAVAMDEREMESMKAVLALLKETDPGWKTALAGTYHPEIARDIYDYSLNYVDPYFEPDVLKERIEAGKPSTYYTACQPPRPNCFTFSPPAEAVWIGWYAMAQGYTGYLRWAYNNWTADVLHDTRYKTWPAGDCYFIYPGPRSSIRFEKLLEGIQDYEKLRILREQFIKEERSDKLKEMDALLANFSKENLIKLPVSDMVKLGKDFIRNN